MSESKNKLRMLCVLEILRKYSDEEHPLSSMKISEILEKEYGIKCDRKATIYSDINTLKEFHDNYFNIINVSTPSKGFCIYEREFQLAELYLLCDAVQSAHSVTKGKSKELVGKLQQFASTYQSKDIGSSVYIDNRQKSDNTQIYYNIHSIHQAISADKKIGIKYIRHNIDRNSERHYTVSPYAMIWSNDRYYLICNNDTKQNALSSPCSGLSQIITTSKNYMPAFSSLFPSNAILSPSDRRKLSCLIDSSIFFGVTKSSFNFGDKSPCASSCLCCSSSFSRS